MTQMSSGSPMQPGAMNTQQRMMGAASSQMAGMQMRGVNQGGPRMTQPGMKNS